jgi:hypothetical protein
MTWNGFLPEGITCKKCGKELSGENGPRPAESYLGTYTGLCYKCSFEAPYIVEVHSDGAITWSYPPHCPNWRRDREEATGYPNCPTCEGSGRIYVPRDFKRGGPYYKYCEECFNLFYNYPKRYEQTRDYDAWRDEIWDQIRDDEQRAIKAAMMLKMN